MKHFGLSKPIKLNNGNDVNEFQLNFEDLSSGLPAD